MTVSEMPVSEMSVSEVPVSEVPVSDVPVSDVSDVSEVTASEVQVSEEVPVSQVLSQLSLDTNIVRPPPSLTTYDLRTRTLTYMLKALNPQSKIPALSPESLQPNPVVVSPENPLCSVLGASAPRRYRSGAERTWLKVLNQVAQLLVREHEIVAVLSKRSGATADVRFMVTTDSDSESDSERAAPSTSSTMLKTNYLIAQNPRDDQPPKTPNHGEALEALQQVSGMDGMLTYLNDHKVVSFSTHVSSIELLLNKVITGSQTEASYPAQCEILRRYITFRAAPKMLRRFTARAFKSFLQAVSALSPDEVALAISVNRPPGATPLSTNLPFDRALVTDIVSFKPFDRSSCPYIVAKYREVGGINYTSKTAWEFHQLLIFCLAQAKKVLTTLNNQLKSDPPTAVTSKALTNAEVWMRYLQNMVHYSPIFKAHIQALESTIAAKMRPQPKMDKRYENSPDSQDEAELGAQEWGSDADAGHIEAQEDDEEENDEDGGMSDTLLEITAAQALDKATQQSLWLSVSYQQAIDVIVEARTLPKTPISMTLWEPPTAAYQSSAEMESWQSVVGDLYPSGGSNTAASGRPRGQSTAPFSVPTDPITAQEVEDVLSEFARSKRSKARLFAPSSEQKTLFRYHAESMLGTLAYLSRHQVTSEQHALPAEELAMFGHAYGTIGVSKRCCPVCTKLLSLLSAHITPPASPTITHDQHASFRVLLAHENIYPTALPPFTPIEVAQELVKWLEDLLKASIDKIVNAERKRMRSGSTSSQGSCASRDSKGHSPPPSDHGGAQEEELRGMGQADGWGDSEDDEE